MEAPKISFLSGNYSPSQAHEMLTKLIKNELQFHRLQNFTSLLRFEGTCDQATANIQQLCQAQEEVNRLVAEAEAEKANLYIKASLQFSFVKEAVEETALVK